MAARFFGAVKIGVYAAIIASVVLPSGGAWAEVVSEQITAPVAVQPTPLVLNATTPDVIMTAFSTGDRLEMVELYNQSTQAVDMGQMTVATTDTAGEARTLRLQPGWLLPKQYVTFAESAFITGALAFGDVQRATSGDIETIRIERMGIETQSVVAPPSSDFAWARHKQRGNASLKQTGDFATDFVAKSASDPVVVMGGLLYTPPVSIDGLELREIHANPSACEPTIESTFDLRCGDYIKVVNNGDSEVNLASLRLRVGKFGDSATISTAFSWGQSTLAPEDEYILAPGAMLLVRLRNDLKPIALSASGNFVWIEDAYGIQTYSYVEYPDLTIAQYRDKSWGYDANTEQWGAANPSPYVVENDFTTAPEVIPAVAEETLKPCKDGQYRSEETGRCRNIALAGDTLTPCKEGQYRSEETNRCRSIVATVAATLKPCADDQFRNPETGRCKKIASTEDELAPCDEGWERNPETNRCRKIKVTDMPLATFPVEPIKQAAGAAGVWWALGGAGTLAVGYAAWEWRREVAGLARRVVTTIGRRK